MISLPKKTKLSLGILAVLIMTLVANYLLSPQLLSSSLIGKNVDAWPGNKLHVRVSRSFVAPGESYILYAGSYQGNALGIYNGLLDYRLILCEASTPQRCGASSEGQWGTYELRNGQVTVSLPPDIPPGLYKAQFRPRGTTWEWSNEVVVNVGTTAGLEDMSRYWLLDGTRRYIGKNHVTGTTTQALIGYSGGSPTCAWMPPDTKTMFFTKDHRDGYWSANYNLPGWGDGRNNLEWYIAPWKRSPGWHDEYLSAVGHKSFAFNRPSDPQSLTPEGSFTNATWSIGYGSADPRFPGYVLSPRWIGPGWGIANGNQLYGSRQGADICSANPSVPGNTAWTGQWSMHANQVNLNLPRYSGPAIQIKFFELSPSWGWDIVENWYFVKDKGLVRIEQKVYGAGTGKCTEDPDCFVNVQMSAPMSELTLDEYTDPTVLAPSPTPTPSPTSTPRPSPTLLPPPVSSPSPSPVPTPTFSPTPTPPQQCATLCTSNFHCCTGQRCVIQSGKITGRCQ